MLETRGLQAWYGESHVLHGVDLKIEGGEAVTLVGRNGSGKTTTLKTIMGMLPKHSGEIHFDGARIDGLTSDRIARRGVGFVPDDRGIYATLTVRENLELPASSGADRWTLDSIYDLFPALKERSSSMGTMLSGGEQQMLAIARVLRSGARMILLDEPTEGLAPVIVDAIANLLLEIKKSGVTMLLVEQNLRFATRVADRHYLMVDGKIVDCLTNAAAIERENELLVHLGV